MIFLYCQIKEWTYCIVCLPRISVDALKNLHFVPDPIVENVACLDFLRIYGTDTEEVTRPMSYCKFWIYWVDVNTKFTIWHLVQRKFKKNKIGTNSLKKPLLQVCFWYNV